MASKTSNLRQVTPDDFDINILRQAALEGRLFISQEEDARSAESQRKEGIRQILTYVSRIDSCASPQHASGISKLWNCILHSEELGDLFFYQRYRSTRGEVNWYRVNVVICLLREMGVYREEFTGVELHCRCERSAKRNAHYTGMGRYLLERSEIVTLKNLVKNADINLNTEISK